MKRIAIISLMATAIIGVVAYLLHESNKDDCGWD